jgi:hypothetical protein
VIVIFKIVKKTKKIKKNLELFYYPKWIIMDNKKVPKFNKKIKLLDHTLSVI